MVGKWVVLILLKCILVVGCVRVSDDGRADRFVPPSELPVAVVPCLLVLQLCVWWHRVRALK